MRYSLFIALGYFAATLVAGSTVAKSSPVPTYHYDNSRTGWNNQETTLTATSFPSTSCTPTPCTFGVLHTLTLDGQVDAQPLVVPCSQTAFACKTDVVYVATHGNTVYAIDASSGAILLQQNLGSPVAPSLPTGCIDNGFNVGIRGTPVADLDPTSPTYQTLYLIAHTSIGGNPVYQLHALDLSTLKDKVNPNPSAAGVTVAGKHTLTDGSTYQFNAAVERQRAALLLVNVNGKPTVYAGFSAFCDKIAAVARGWLLRWDAATLQQLLQPDGTANKLTDTQATDPGVTPPVFESSIWMSGYGIASDGTDLYFATGNSDCNFEILPQGCPSKSSWDGKTNIQESVVRLSSDLTTIKSIFSPSNRLTLDQHDNEIGSGGVLVLPPLGGNLLAVAAGKDGRLFLFNRLNLGTPLDTHQISACWCGPSYFVGPDGLSRVVTSQGTSLQTWHVNLSPSPHLSGGGKATISSGQDGGFFTAVSCSSTIKFGQCNSGAGIIWAVSRPTGTPTTVTLYAFAAIAPTGTFTKLFSGPAGSWPSTGHNANIVPVVANGKVYVASAFLDASGKLRGQLNIFGICPSTGCIGKPLVNSRVASDPSPHAVSGILIAVNGTTLILKKRNGKSATIDASQAAKNKQIGAPLKAGVALTVLGSSFEPNGVLLATSIYKPKGTSGELWQDDH